MLVPPANFGIAEEGIYRCSKVETLNLSFLETLNLKTVLFLGGQEPSKYFKEFFKNSNISWHVVRNIDFLPAQDSIGIATQHSENSEKEKLGDQNFGEESVNLQSEQKMSTPSLNSEISLTSNISDSLVQDKEKDNDNDDNNKTSSNTIIRDANETISNPREENVDKEKGNSKSRYRKYYLTDNDELMIIKSKCLRKTFEYMMNTDYHNLLLVDRTSIIVGILRKLQKWNIASILNEYRLFAGKNGNYFAETFLDLIKLSIKQDIDETNENIKLEQLKHSQEGKKQNKNRPNSKNKKNLKIVNEDDLLSEPTVPVRILKLINDVKNETQNRIKFLEKDNSNNETKDEDKNLGIFGNQYRLAFNRKELGEYEYYKNEKTKKKNEQKDETTLNNPTQHSNNQKPSHPYDNSVKIHIPIESKLPSWFIYQRNLWEQINVKQEHNFYAETVFI